MIAEQVGLELTGCAWVGVPFAGGMSELAEISANSLIVSDLHGLVINLARCIADPVLKEELSRRLSALPFHPAVLAEAQRACKAVFTDSQQPCFAARGDPDMQAAVDYFVACWMGRSHKSGTVDEFNGGLSMRWNANGGDSNVRYRSAIVSLDGWQRIMQRCSFHVLNAFEFLDNCDDETGRGIYCDPPFPKRGDKYRFKFTEADHHRLASKLSTFTKARVVCRFYDDPLIREIYPASRWTWRFLEGGRTQTNAEAPEVLLLNGPTRSQTPAAPPAKGLFA
jgi:site-specific DNA-adenine methylase